MNVGMGGRSKLMRFCHAIDTVAFSRSMTRGGSTWDARYAERNEIRVPETRPRGSVGVVGEHEGSRFEKRDVASVRILYKVVRKSSCYKILGRM